MGHKRSAFLLLLAAAVVVWILAEPRSAARDAEPPWAAPEFTHTSDRDWINSAPLTWADLDGKVVLVDFWTYGCWNCYRSFPWLSGLEAQFEDREFAVLGVHTPEFEHEKDRARVAAKVVEFGLSHPVMIDNDFSYWKAMKNRYWPTFYLIDKAGRVRASYIGEIHSGDSSARAVEAKIKELLQESVDS